ncbi:MAG: hypothetical protein LBF58_11550 [Deltaproteobacteria bacterium]|jgi:hypothetical protein|nr:hypothetical protein [Deltaproteobacteria bacterium]
MSENIPPLGYPEIPPKNRRILWGFFAALCFLCVAATITFVALVGNGNPLIGTWKIDPDADTVLSFFAFGPFDELRITITPKRMLLRNGTGKGDTELKISSRNEDGRWFIVLPEKGEKNEVVVIDENRIVIKNDEALFGGDLALVRAD